MRTYLKPHSDTCPAVASCWSDRTPARAQRVRLPDALRPARARRRSTDDATRTRRRVTSRSPSFSHLVGISPTFADAASGTISTRGGANGRRGGNALRRFGRKPRRARRDPGSRAAESLGSRAAEITRSSSSADLSQVRRTSPKRRQRRRGRGRNRVRVRVRRDRREERLGTSRGDGERDATSVPDAGASRLVQPPRGLERVFARLRRGFIDEVHPILRLRGGSVRDG